jgi:hypothetical protein
MLPFNIFAKRATPAAAIIIPISIAISGFHMYAGRYIGIQALLYSLRLQMILISKRYEGHK